MGTDTECRSFLCNGASAVCDTIDAAAGATCTEKTPDDRNDVGCDGSGNCVFIPLTGSCGSPTDCEVGTCDASIGGPNTRRPCVITPKPVDDACTLADVPQCSDPRCDADGNCVLQPTDGAACTLSGVELNGCNEARCNGDTCELVPLPAGTACTDTNLCDVDVCNDAGECVHTPAIDCSVPLSTCHFPGQCVPETGECSYETRPTGSVCTPLVEDTRCRFYTCQASS